MKPNLPITLTDIPAVVRLKRQFAAWCDHEQVLKEMIALRQGDVPAHYIELEAVAAKKVRLANQITEHQHRESPRLSLV